MSGSIHRGGWLRAFVALGLILRAYHYLRCPSVWHDEGALAVNILAGPIGSVFGPLTHTQAAPPLFLLAERATVAVLGDGVLALRLVPFLASCAALLLVAGLARRALGPHAAALAVGFAAVSDRLLWHAAEVKPYSTDVLVAAAAGYWAALTEGWPLWRRCLPAAFVAPIAVWMSYTAAFVAGGLLVGFGLLAIRRTATWADRAAFTALAAAVAGAFVALAVGPVAAQQDRELDRYWAHHLADWSRPWYVPVWSVASTCEVARYCLIPLGHVMAPMIVLGAWAMWRRDDVGRRLVLVLLLPWALALLAGLLGKYPYGGSRLEVFAAPAVCVFTAEGVRRVVPYLWRRSRILAGAVLVLAVVPLGQAAFRATVPWPRAACDEAAAFIRDRRRDDDTVVMNGWEYDYYFRDLPGRWRRWDGRFEPADTDTAGRVWVVHTVHSDTPPPTFPFPTPTGWSVTDTRVFRLTTVYRLERTP